MFVNAGVNIGDGGRSWIEKAYERAVQQAKEEGVPLEDIVKKRWGVREIRFKDNVEGQN